MQVSVSIQCNWPVRLVKVVPSSVAANSGLGSLKLEYDANKNPQIFQQLCQLDLKQVINQVTAETCRP